MIQKRNDIILFVPRQWARCPWIIDKNADILFLKQYVTGKFDHLNQAWANLSDKERAWNMPPHQMDQTIKKNSR